MKQSQKAPVRSRSPISRRGSLAVVVPSGVAETTTQARADGPRTTASSGLLAHAPGMFVSFREM
ncbi:hypothetical protein [Haladaptatus halobius]|uniref:hypothetical protein n=1 Tax=Haladaptatus halobius TaxID=2884875 RepID=UPI001D0BD60E|nr:hypothetical protein [Haladaptatus halobius]